MRNKSKAWIKTSNIYKYLLAKSVLALLLLVAAQAFFYFYNTRIFHVQDAREWLGILWGNLIFNCSTLGYVFLPFYAVNLLPFKFRWNKHFHRLTEIFLYYLPIVLLLGINIGDAAYYQFTYRNLSGEIFKYVGVGGDMGALWPHFLIDYWPATLFGLCSFVVLFWLGSQLHLTNRNKHNKHTVNDLVGMVMGALCIIFLFRGGFGKNVQWRDAAKYCQAKNSALVTNSGYNILRTLWEDKLEEVNYMTPSEAQKQFNPVFEPDTTLPMPQPTDYWAAHAGKWATLVADSLQPLATPKATQANVVIIVLESFSQEYMGCYNQGIMPSFTPFLDSLAQHSFVYQGRSNGKKSIEGIPAIFASIPTLMTFPLTLSDYANNDLYALPDVLSHHGYHTAFFHGSYNGVMGFDYLCSHMGFNEYYGKNEYLADRYARQEDFDGCWGIYDEHFLQYMVRKLSTFPQPFMAGAFTLSSHHPYTMQPGHENDFQEGPHPLCRVVMYSDNALRKFFDAARQTSWYDNTLFVITADHPGQGLHPAYNDYNGWYRIPMMFYLPRADEAHNHHTYTRLMQQTDIMPTLLDYLGIQTHAVCFGTSAFRSPNQGWQIAYGNGYYQLETQDGIAVLCDQKEEGNGNFPLLKAVIQQYNQRLIQNKLKQ
ncbi:MAG: sulfatase-like hydrolase/transferase [Bacteroidales bacterium]|nr:sulfatase-like hydrolase/transferase [Bacteroidales bacterium]